MAENKKPYGSVPYADPGYKPDGIKRYPIDTAKHVKAAWSYINQTKNEEGYSAKQLEHIKEKIKHAAKKFGIEISEERSKPESQTRTQVDLQNNVADLTSKNNNITMPETQIDANKIRAQVEQEHKIRSETVLKRNEEVASIAADFVKQYGHRWNGPKGQRFVVGEKIRALQIEAMNAPADHDIAEVRKDFKRKASELVEGSTEPKNQQMAADLPAEISTRCSLRNVYNAAARSKERSACFIPNDGAEREAHDEIFHRAADFPGGVEMLGEGLHLPVSMPSGVRGKRSKMTRDSLAGDFATAGALVAPEFIFPTIELLRNLPALSRAGMTVLSGVMGNLVLPRQEAATTVQSAVEGAALTQYDQVLGQIKMEPHRVGSSQNYSRLVLMQTSTDFESMVMHDHLSQIALYIDDMGINGQGAGDQPTGILNQIGIGSVAFGGSAANAYKNMIGLETAIRKNNVYDPVSFITTSNTRGTLRVTPATLTGSTVVSGSTNSIWTTEGGEEECVGRTAVDSQQVPNDIMICGAFRHFVLAQWGGLAVVLDTISLASSDKYRLSINTYIDFACRHAQAFSRSADSVATLS